MLYYICGDNTILSREHYTNLKKEYTQKGYEIKEIEPTQIKDIFLYMADSLSLFYKEKVFFTERLDSQITLKRGRKKSLIENSNETISVIETIAQKKDIILINWEEKPKRELKLKIISQVKEFKLERTIFKLLELCYPTNKLSFIDYLRKLTKEMDVPFLFIMLYRHIRLLILAYHNILPSTIQTWQKAMFTTQAHKWNIDKLYAFYEGLYRIEVLTRSGQNPYTLQHSLEILACYYL